VDNRATQVCLTFFADDFYFVSAASVQGHGLSPYQEIPDNKQVTIVATVGCRPRGRHRGVMPAGHDAVFQAFAPQDQGLKQVGKGRVRHGA
ncbi:hypothetical protein, partial [Klebsiella pneumoniae]|uniref:hypothetical protein n=1 Tax=Klebsiella pneumoniae TaxID=573 RepID=UPI0039C08EC7